MSSKYYIIWFNNRIYIAFFLTKISHVSIKYIFRMTTLHVTLWMLFIIWYNLLLINVKYVIQKLKYKKHEKFKCLYDELR